MTTKLGRVAIIGNGRLGRYLTISSRSPGRGPYRSEAGIRGIYRSDKHLLHYALGQDTNRSLLGVQEKPEDTPCRSSMDDSAFGPRTLMARKHRGRQRLRASGRCPGGLHTRFGYGPERPFEKTIPQLPRPLCPADLAVGQPPATRARWQDRLSGS